MDEKRTVLDTKDKFSLIEEDESRDDDDDDEFELMDKVEKKLNLKKHLSEDQDEDIINLDDLNLNEEDNNINTVCNVINSDEIRENENTAPKSTPFREDIPHGTSPVAEEIQHGSSPIEEDIQQRTSPIILTNNEINIVMEKSDSDEMNLNDLDLKIVPKETAIELLLNKNLETKKKTIKILKKNSKYDNIKSHFETSKLNQISYQMPSDLTEKDPEITYDFNTACTKYLANLLKGPNHNYNKLLKLMIYNSKIEEIQKLENSEPSVYYSKVNMYLDKKKRILESIQKKIKEDFLDKHTFSPKTNVDKNHEILDFSLFLDNQNKFTHKVTKKVSQLKQEIEKKKVIEAHPKISENTIKIYNEKIKKNNDPIYLRLYKMRNDLDRKTKQKKETDTKKTKKFNEEYIEELFNRLYKEAFSKPDLIKEIEQEYLKLKTKDKFSSKSSNKIVLKRFLKQYKSVIVELESKANSENLSKSIENSKSIDNTNSLNITATNNITTNITTININNNAVNNSDNLTETSNNVAIGIITPQILGNKMENKLFKLNFLQLSNKIINSDTILLKLNLTSKEKENSNNTTIVNFNESSLKQKEKKLVNELYDNLKDSEGYINKDQLFIFLLSILNLYEFYLVKMNLEKFDTNDILREIAEKEQQFHSNKNDLKSSSKNKHMSFEKIGDKISNEDEKINKYIIDKINTEILSKLKITKKYCGFDEKGNFYITMQMSKTINRDFNIFGINCLNSFYDNKKQLTSSSLFESKNMTFKPCIDEKSKKLSLKFRRKIQSEVESHIGRFLADRNSLNLDSDKFNLNYMKLLLIKKQKDEKLMAKKKEEHESRELKQCTFKPKILNYESNNNLNNTENNRNDKFEVLYKVGLAKTIGRKNRTKEDFELEKYGKNCSFKPETKGLPKLKNTDFFDINFNEKEYINKFNRLKAGRLERKLKDIIHSREPFSSKIDIKDIKSIKIESSYSPRSRRINKEENSKPKVRSYSNLNESNRKNRSIDKINFKICEEDKFTTIKHDKGTFKNNLDDKNVNIRPGEKKKIYVFDGDTAEVLSEKFCKENTLDNETKIKLKVLIQNHMSKLLMRIEEENHSILSESSINQFIF